MKYLKKYKAFNEDGEASVNASTTAGMGAVTNAQPGSLPGTFGTDGSGDITFTFKKEGRKKGGPTEISDLRDLKDVKTNKVEEGYNSEQEYINEIMDKLKIYNIRPLVLNKILDFYQDRIKADYNDGKYPKIFVDEIVKDMELDSGGFMSQKVGAPRNQSIKNL